MKTRAAANHDAMSDRTPLLPAAVATSSAKMPRPAWWRNPKLRVIMLMLVLMMLYSGVELVVSLWINSLVMFSDGLHNLSDGLALVVAFYAERKKLESAKGHLTYGWRRTELLGGLFNGLFLVSMCVFVFLQAVPDLIEIRAPNGDMEIVYVAGAGIVLNVLGTVIFMSTGHGHGHGGGECSHGHGHGKKESHGHGSDNESNGNGHGHSHGNGSKRKEASAHGHSHGTSAEAFGYDVAEASGHDHGHGHSHGTVAEASGHGHSHGTVAEASGHDHGHSHGTVAEASGHDHGHSAQVMEEQESGHSHGYNTIKVKEGESGHGHGPHGHGIKGNGNDHGGDPQEVEEETSGHGHGRSHGTKEVEDGSGRGHDIEEEKEEGSGHAHGHSTDESGHGHSHSNARTENAPLRSTEAAEAAETEENGHDYGHGRGPAHITSAPSRPPRDYNMWGLFIHFMGDVLTSVLVLAVGLVSHFYQYTPESAGVPGQHLWVPYMDPAASIVSVIIILVSAVPLVKSCSWILLQTSPPHVNVAQLQALLLEDPAVLSIHELHIWQLVDGLTVASAHVVISREAAWTQVLKTAKEVLHRHDVHSITLQPEFQEPLTTEESTGPSPALNKRCLAPCIPSCEADTCCPEGEDDHGRPGGPAAAVGAINQDSLC